MEETPKRNADLEKLDIFTTANHYALLIFGGICLLGSIFIQAIFMAVNQYRLGIPVSVSLSIIFPIYLLTRRFKGGFARQMHIEIPEAKMLARVFVASLMAIVVIDHIYAFTQHFIPVPEDYYEGIMALKPSGAGTLIVTFIGICLIVPFAEELLFRGFVQQIFARNMNEILAFVLAGFVFGAVHLSAHLLVSVSIFGILLGYIFYVTRNLIYSILVHGILNGVSLMQLTFTPEDKLGEPPFYAQQVWTFVGAIVLLWFLLLDIKKGAAEEQAPDKE